MQRYAFLDFTSDVMFEAYGKDPREMFVNAASALFSVICEIEEVEPKKRVEIEVESESLEDLLYDWLSTLLTESEINEMFFSKFDIDEMETDARFYLRGRAHGEAMTVVKGGTLVKGVTYYKLEVRKEKDGIVGKVTLDI
ncbi:MAG: archease [Candidatus Hydrothermarchaeales archaeon]